MFSLITTTLQSLHRDRSGATAIEYGLIAALVAVVIIGALELLGGGLIATFTDVTTKLGG